MESVKTPGGNYPEMLILSVIGLIILIFLLASTQRIIEIWINNGRPINEKISIIVSSVTAFFAFLAAGAALASGWIFYGQLQEMREDKRAWVGPISAGLPNGLPQEGNPATVTVQYHNTGRELYTFDATPARGWWFDDEKKAYPIWRSAASRPH